MASDTNTLDPTATDTIEVLARKLLEAVNAVNGGAVATSFYSEGTLPLATDPLRRTLVKAVFAMRAVNGGGVNVGSEIIYISMQPTVDGDGVTDDSAAIQAIIDANPGKTIVFEPGKTYRLDTRLIVEDVVLWGYDATFDYHASGDVTGHLVRDNTHVHGGTWITTSDVAPTGGESASGFYQTNFQIGAYAAEIAGVTGGTGYHNITMNDLTIQNTALNRNAIFITGDSHAIRINRTTVPTSTTIGRPFLVHWGGWKTAGTYIVGDTRHPHDIVVDGVEIGTLSYSTAPTGSGLETSPFVVSGCYGVTFRNVVCEQSIVGGSIYAGDVGFRWATVAENMLAYSGLRFENIHVRRCVKYGAIMYGLSTDTSDLVWRIPAEWVGCSWRGPADASITGSTDFAGISPRAVEGGIFLNCNVSGFEYGVYATIWPTKSAFRVHDLQIVGGLFHDNYQQGIKVDSATIDLTKWMITRTDCRLNGVGGGAGVTTAGIYMGKQNYCEVSHNLLGDPVSEPRQQYGVRVDSNSIGLRLTINHVRSTITTNVAYSIGSGPDDGQILCSEVSGNTKATLPGSNLLYAGALNLPVHGGYKELLPGDTNATADMTSNGPTTVVFDSPITADRAVSFTNYTLPGAKGRYVRVVRTANATGAFNVNVGVGPLVQLTAVKQWADIEATGTAERLVGYGTLP